MCKFANCNKRPNYNLPSEKKGLFCSEHKTENMIDVKNTRCCHLNCMTIPNYNLPSEKKGLFCSEHKTENMIDIKHTRCCHDNCMTRPNYNLPTETKGLFCVEHKTENMIDVINKRCLFINCIKQPTFNIPTETKGLFCSEHKSVEMIDIKTRRCCHLNCMKIPAFNIPTETKGIFCSEHKTENMIDVKKKTCQHEKCKELSLFGLINKRPQYCIKHKQPKMINIVLYNKCSVLECDEEYEHLICNDKYCNKHAPLDYTTTIKRLCRFCDIKDDITFVCKECKKIQNKKEWAIVRHLRKVIDTPFEYNSSKMLQGCSKKRPDVYFELATHCVIVEIDEHQHKTYEDTCECARINEIVNGIGGKPVIIIRYNPDTVKNNGKQINITQNERIELLIKTIKDELIKIYETFVVKIIQIFYNDSYDTYQPIKEEIITDKVCI